MMTFEKHFEKIHPCICLKDRNLLLFDIETTGLSYDRSLLYMITCGYYEQSGFHTVTFFNDDGISEESILRRFVALLESRNTTSDLPLCLVSFNGLTFDVPFLNRHLYFNDIDYDLSVHSMLDLFKEYKSLKTILGLCRCRQTDFEDLLGISRLHDKNGKELIGIYRKFLKSKDEALLEELLRHNIYDVVNLEALLPLYYLKSLPDLVDTLLDTDISADRFLASVSLKYNTGLEVALCSDLCDEICMNIIGQRIVLSIPVSDESVRIYYENHKDYYYLPLEDRAVHKSVGAFVDKNHREKAKRETCYDRISTDRLAGLPDSAMLPLLLSQMKCIFRL